MTYTQKGRPIAISTPLKEDALLLRAFSGTEGISQLFRFDLDLLSLDDQLDMDMLVGQSVSVRLDTSLKKNRFFNGIVSRFSQAGRDQAFSVYHAEVVPWFWMLTRNANCRIFQHQSVPGIIKKIFEEGEFSDFSMKGLGLPHPVREYCVQYRETNFNFLSRLMEEEGMYYFFEHEDGKHTLMIRDTPQGHPDCPCQPEAKYHPTQFTNKIGYTVEEWHLSRELRPGSYTLNTFNYEYPGLPLLAPAAGRNALEIYDYPADYQTLTAGRQMARLRLEETETPRIQGRGRGDCRTFSAGYKFRLTEHYRSDQNQEYVITSVSHTANAPGDFRSGSDSSGDFLYQNAFECIPYSTPFRPPRITPKPVIQGSQTAIVTGKEGSEISTDNYGRVTVRFHWDRADGKPEDSSCPIRVSQLWAGQNWGSLSIPRVGQEVIVDFLEGDPDKPIITGRVYNASQPVPYNLPGEADQMGFKSNSLEGGGGYNEIVIKDAKAGELIRIHAQKNMETSVLVDQKELVKQHKNIHVLKELRTKVDTKVSCDVSGDVAEHFKQNHAEVVGSERYLKADRIILEAGTEICLKVGGNHVLINSAGVSLDGTMVDLNCGHPPSVTSLASLMPSPPDDPT